MSPVGVEVACALTWTMSVLASPESRSASLIARAPPAPSRVGLHDVVAVRGHPGAGQPGVDVGATGGGVVGSFEHDHTGALTQHEAVAGLVPWPRRPFRVVVAGRHGTHRGEPGDRQRLDDRLGAAGHHDVGASGSDDVQRPGDRLRAGRARAGRRVHAGLRAEFQTDPGGRPVRHQHGHGVRADPPGSGLLQDVVLAEQGLSPADAAADNDGEPLRIDSGRDRRAGIRGSGSQAGVLPSLMRRDQRDRFGAVEPAQLDPVDHFGRLDGELRRDPYGELGGPLLGQRRDPGATGQHGVPGRRDVPAERGRRAEPGNDDVRCHCVTPAPSR